MDMNSSENKFQQRLVKSLNEPIRLPLNDLFKAKHLDGLEEIKNHIHQNQDNSEITQMVKELQKNFLEENQKMMDLLKGYVNVQMDRNTDMKKLIENHTKELNEIKSTLEKLTHLVEGMSKQKRSKKDRG